MPQLIREYYFSCVGVFLVALTILGFSDNLFTDTRQESNFDPKFVVHGLFCLAWMILFAVQTNLIRSWNHRTHKRLGIAMISVAAGVVLSTLYVFVSIWEGWDKLVFYARPNRFFLPSFAVLVALGYLYRKTPDLHKRFMFVATIYMLGPVLDRASGHLGISAFIVNPVVWNALFLSLFVFDWVTIRRIHAITYLGFAWLYVVWAIAFLT